MACVHHWNSPLQVGSQHLAGCLLRRGWEVAYVSAPVTPLHLLKAGRDGLARRFAIWKRGGVWHQPQDYQGRLFSYVPAALVAPDSRPLLRSQAMLRNWQRLSLPQAPRVLHVQGFGQVDLLYLDNFFHTFWLKAVTWRKSIYRMTDVHAGFPGHNSSMTAVEQQLAQAVDLVAYPSLTMAPLVDAMAPGKGVFLSNGVDATRFTGPLPPCPAALENIPKPRLMFVGALERWVDAELLAEVARAYPQAQLVCIGPRGRSLSELAALDNVHLLGERCLQETAACLRHAQLGLLPYDLRHYSRLVAPLRPLKLFEYLAAGLPVVSMHWPELMRMQAPVRVCNNSQTFVRAVGELLHKEHDPEAGRLFAQRHSWDAACQDMLQALELDGSARDAQAKGSSRYSRKSLSA